MDKVKIFDTTLRDGEQAPGYSMHSSEKLEIAQQLARLKVDIIEAGFAASSEADSDAIRRIAQAVKGVTICSLARATTNDIDKAYLAVRDADDARINVFLATSPLHMQYKLKMSPDEVLLHIEQSVKYAKSKVSDVQFSAEDAMRSDPAFLLQALKTAIAAGATTVNIPDTVGYSCPSEIIERFRYIIGEAGAQGVTFAVHCHNDLGMAVANSLAAVTAGARQVDCTVNGIGERAGNAPLEEVVMAIKTRPQLFSAETRVVTSELYKTSKLVSSITGVKLSPSKAIVGKNAFRHESGIHQHGVLANPATYEIMVPEDVGIVENDLVLGKHSGRHAFATHLVNQGYRFEPAVVDVLFGKFKELASKKKIVTDKDIESLIINTNKNSVEKKYALVSYSLSADHGKACAKLTLASPDGECVVENVGDGPVDAAFKAINDLVKRDVKLDDFSLSSVSEGEDALGVAVLRMSLGNVTMSGRGVSTDIVEASILAYINGVNKLLEE